MAGWVVGFLPWDRSQGTEGQEGTAANEQQVHDLLADNGGRLYQSDVVAARDWSQATVSRTLSAMERDDEIVRLRDGRRKVVCHPDRVPDRSRTDPVE